MKNETIQYKERLKDISKTCKSKESIHKWANWKDWLVFEAFRDEIRTIKRGYILGENGKLYELSRSERSRMLYELFSFMEFIYRTWTDKDADAWVGGTWHQNMEAFFARMLFDAHKRGVTKVRLKKKPPAFEDARKTFCEVFGIDL